MNKAKFVHSWWSAPLSQEPDPGRREFRLRATLALHALSLAYLRRLGRPCRLVTDDVGYLLLQNYGYDRVDVTLSHLKVDPWIWAAGKVAAYSTMAPDEVHIDGDVFIKTALCAETIDRHLQRYDVYGQCYELFGENANESDYATPRNYIAGVCAADGVDFQPSRCVSILNAGVVAFSNVHARNEYCNQYFKLAELLSSQFDRERRECRSNPEKCSCDSCFKSRSGLLDLYLEQERLGAMAPRYRTGSLLGAGADSFGEANRLGFQHLIGYAKLDQFPKVVDTLKKLSPCLYRAYEAAVERNMEYCLQAVSKRALC